MGIPWLVQLHINNDDAFHTQRITVWSSDYKYTIDCFPLMKQSIGRAGSNDIAYRIKYKESN